MERVSGREWYNRIDDKIILGAIPFRSMLEKLKLENVRAILSINMPYELDSRFYPTKMEFTQYGMVFKNIQVLGTCFR